MTWELVVLAAASLLALQIFNVVQRREARGHLPYLAMMAVDLAVLCYASGAGAHEALYSKVVASLALVLTLVPRFLDGAERRALARDRLATALRCAWLRELIVPGRASTRQRRHFQHLMQAQRGDADGVVRGLERELAATSQPAAALELREELLTALFVAQRWAALVEQAERHVPFEHLQRRLTLGLYVVLALGELGRLEEAAALLERLEASPAAREAGPLLQPTRLNLIAFTGRTELVDELVRGEVGATLPPRARAALQRTAHAHAGRPLTPALERASDALAARLRAGAQPLMAPSRRRPRVTFALIGLNLVCYAVEWMVPHAFDNASIIRLGAIFRPAMAAGEYWRALSSMFLHAGGWHVGLNMYGLYVLGRFCEQQLGAARYFVIYIIAGLCGAAASAVAPRQIGLSVGASGAIMGLLGAVIVLLVLRRGHYPEAWRRMLLWNLLFLGALQILIGFQVEMIDNAAHVGGMIGGAAATLLFAPDGLVGARRLGRALALGAAALCAAMLAWAALAVARTPLERTLARLPTHEVTVADVRLTVPTDWELDAAHGRLVDPFLDLEVEPRRQGEQVTVESPQESDARFRPLIARVRASARPAE